MEIRDSQVYRQAIHDFVQARRRASLHELLSGLTGRSNQLLPYNDIARDLQITNVHSAGLEEVPLEAIVGSVGRYGDFTRDFLPRHDSDKERWARVKAAMTSGTGLPPVDLYKLGELYFVRDGNHRVSVARQLGNPTIEAHVTEVHTRVPLGKSDQPDEIIVKARYAAFLLQTNLDKLRPDADLTMTLPGYYRLLLEHIEVHRYYMGIDFQREISYEEAVTHWYDAVYRPVINLIHELGVMHYFPNRTETDLYALVAEHRREIEEGLGWDVDAPEVIVDLVEAKSSHPDKLLDRVSERLYDVVVPDELERGPEAGQWRARRRAPRPEDRLFADILVALASSTGQDHLLTHALRLAQREDSRLLGIHVAEDGQPTANKAARAVLREIFNKKLASAGIKGKLVFDSGPVGRVLVSRSSWADLLVVSLTPSTPYQTSSTPHRLSTRLRTILNRTARPVLAVPPAADSDMKRAILAYDGSPRANEALYVAAYAAHRWLENLVVVVAGQRQDAEPLAQQAQAYLAEQGLQVRVIVEPERAGHLILRVAEREAADLIIMGAFGATPVRQLILG
ncbi:MAG: universal stress protein, partial [Anaerolineales bacterium]|nr:universal stress protein [Anaerolineales bacterium]